MKKPELNLIIVGFAILLQGCEKQNNCPNSDSSNAKECTSAVITFNTNELLSVSYGAIMQQHPEIKKNWLKFERISYNSERPEPPLHIIFYVIEPSYDNPGAELLWVEMNENGSEPEVKILRRPIGRIKR